MSQGLVLLEQRLSRTREQAAQRRDSLPTLREQIKASLSDYIGRWFRSAPKTYLEREPGIEASDEKLRELRDAAYQLASRAAEFVEREFGSVEGWDLLPKPIKSGSAFKILEDSYGPFTDQLRRISAELDTLMNSAGFTAHVTITLPDQIRTKIREYQQTNAEVDALETTAREVEREVERHRAADRWDRL